MYVVLSYSHTSWQLTATVDINKPRGGVQVAPVRGALKRFG